MLQWTGSGWCSGSYLSFPLLLHCIRPVSIVQRPLLVGGGQSWEVSQGLHYIGAWCLVQVWSGSPGKYSRDCVILQWTGSGWCSGSYLSFPLLLHCPSPVSTVQQPLPVGGGWSWEAFQGLHCIGAQCLVQVWTGSPGRYSRDCVMLQWTGSGWCSGSYSPFLYFSTVLHRLVQCNGPFW